MSLGWRLVRQFVLGLLAFGLLFFLSAGTPRYWEGWAFLGVLFVPGLYLLTPVMDEVGLGFFLDIRNPGQFGQTGADNGFQALLTMNAKTGKGAAMMANSDMGISAAEFIVDRVAKEYGFNYNPGTGAYATLLLLAKMKGARAALQPIRN